MIHRISSLSLFFIGRSRGKGVWLIVGGAEEVPERLLGGLFADLGDRLGEGDFFGANAGAVLGVAAAGNPTLFHHRVQALGALHISCRMVVKEAHLGDRCRTHKL